MKTRFPLLIGSLMAAVVLLAACQAITAPAGNSQATVQALVATQIAQVTAAVPMPDYPATIQAQADQLAQWQATAQAALAITPAPPAAPTPDDAAMLRYVVASYMGIPPSQLDITISELAPPFARGGVALSNEIGGGMWLAAKVEGVWLIAYMGQGVPECERINPLNIPVDWADYCVTADGQTLHR